LLRPAGTGQKPIAGAGIGWETASSPQKQPRKPHVTAVRNSDGYNRLSIDYRK
jgi:hypothetical protein